jgi:hypothetical protein
MACDWMQLMSVKAVEQANIDWSTEISFAYGLS